MIKLAKLTTWLNTMAIITSPAERAMRRLALSSMRDIGVDYIR